MLKKTVFAALVAVTAATGAMAGSYSTFVDSYTPQGVTADLERTKIHYDAKLADKAFKPLNVKFTDKDGHSSVVAFAVESEVNNHFIDKTNFESFVEELGSIAWTHGVTDGVNGVDAADRDDIYVVRSKKKYDYGLSVFKVSPISMMFDGIEYKWTKHGAKENFNINKWSNNDGINGMMNMLNTFLRDAYEAGYIEGSY